MDGLNNILPDKLARTQLYSEDDLSQKASDFIATYPEEFQKIVSWAELGTRPEGKAYNTDANNLLEELFNDFGFTSDDPEILEIINHINRIAQGLDEVF